MAYEAGGGGEFGGDLGGGRDREGPGEGRDLNRLDRFSTGMLPGTPQAAAPVSAAPVAPRVKSRSSIADLASRFGYGGGGRGFGDISIPGLPAGFVAGAGAGTGSPQAGGTGTPRVGGLVE